MHLCLTNHLVSNIEFFLEFFFYLLLYVFLYFREEGGMNVYRVEEASLTLPR